MKWLRSLGAMPELMMLTVLSLLTRCWMLFNPDAVVWDEIHYERFAAAYYTHHYYVDVHPPLAKMLLAWFGVLFGATPAEYAGLQPATEARILPALAGALIVPVVYLIVRELGGGRRTATLAASLLLFDNALTAISRLMLIDSLLLLFGLLTLLFYLVARRHDGIARLSLVAASALFAGAAVSTKWTGLSALGLVGLIWLADSIALIRAKRFRLPRITEAVLLVALPLSVYVGSFAIHFAQLTSSRNSTMPLLAKTIELNREMQRINKAWAADSNVGASKWYTWPIAKHSVGFYLRQTPDTSDIQWIILFGNPIVWLGALGGMIIVIIQLARRDARLLRHRWSLGVLGVGYLANFLPFAPIARPMYLYHYFFALIFSVMFAAIGIGALLNLDVDSPLLGNWRSSRQRAWTGTIVLAAVLFAYMSPFTYGWPLSPEGVSHRMHVLERH